MNLTPLQYVGLIGMVVLGIMFALEVFRWRRSEVMITRTQRLLRTGIVILMEAIFLLAFLGPWLICRDNVIAVLAYYTFGILLALAVVVLALLDLRAVAMTYSSATRRMTQELTEDWRRDGK